MTGPHGSQPTAARQGTVCAPMPAGKPSAELGEILQQVLQGLSRGEESGAAPRVAVLLDRPQPYLSHWLGPALGARELIVCSMRDEQDEQDGCPETEPVEYSGLIGPARVVGFTNQVDLHQALATHGRFDVLVDALTHSPGMRATSATAGTTSPSMVRRWARASTPLGSSAGPRAASPVCTEPRGS